MGIQNMSQAELCHLLVIFPLIISPSENKVVDALKTFLRSLRVGFIPVMPCLFHGLLFIFKYFVNIKICNCNTNIMFVS